MSFSISSAIVAPVIVPFVVKIIAIPIVIVSIPIIVPKSFIVSVYMSDCPPDLTPAIVKDLHVSNLHQASTLVEKVYTTD